MNITGIRDDLYRLLDVNPGVTVSDYVKADCANALNRALQTMSLAGKDYFLAETVTQAVTSGTAEYALGGTIQRVVGPVRMQSGPHLRELRSRGQFDGYGIYFAGETSMGSVSGSPRAYFLEAQKSASGADAVTLTLCLAPTPNANGTAEFDAIKEPTTYTATNMADTGVTVPVAHQYTENILLPLCRHFLTRSRYFTNEAMRPQIEADYSEAMAMLGLGEPVQNVTRKTAPELEEAA